MNGMRVGADILFFNPYLRQARIDAGFNTCTALCRYSGLNLVAYCQYERLKRYPSNLKIIAKLEHVLHQPYETLFPEPLRQAIDLRRGNWQRISIVKEIPITSLRSKELLGIADESMTEHLEDEDRQDIIKQILETLHPRERAILERRFGLNGHPETTLNAIAKEFGVSRERIRHIEMKALSKLRRPTRSKLLVEAGFDIVRKSVST